MAENEKIKIAIIDDHKLFRDGISELINQFEHFAVISESDNGREFVEKVFKGESPDIVILDINMKEMDGYETAAWIRDNLPQARVLALTMYDNENAIIRMLRLGARGYILKDVRKQELHRALTSLQEKGFYYTDLITGKLIHAISQIGEDQPENTLKQASTLNPREIDFLKLACTELTYKDIADKMNLSIHTIDGYREDLFTKLKVKSRVGLVLFAIRNKIVLID